MSGNRDAQGEGKRWEQPVSGAVRAHMCQLSSVLFGQFVVPQTHYNNNIKDHSSQITVRNMMKIFEILQKLPKCDRDIK